MSMIYLKNVATLNLYLEKCTGCGICIDVCPRAVLVENGKKVAISDVDLCIECGACALNCPFGAISVTTGVGCAKALMKQRKGNSQPCCGESSISRLLLLDTLARYTPRSLVGIKSNEFF